MNLEPLRISDLAATTGVSIASVKFYLREGLLQPGNPERKHRAYYGPEHVKRLRLIRTLREVGGLSVSAIHQVIDSMQAKNTPTSALIARTLDALAADHDARSATAQDKGKLAELHAFLVSRGVEARVRSQAVLELCRAVDGIREMSGEIVPLEALDPYIDVARKIATEETDAQLLTGDAQTALQHAVLGTILWERVLLNLRRIMHEQLAMEVFHAPQAAKKTKRSASRSPR